MSEQELSASGYPIYRHTARKSEFQPAIGNEETIEQIERHVEKHLGEVDGVFHEIISDLVHLDVFIIKPRPERNYYTLVTCGMSDLPMTVPEGAEAFQYAELMLCLPPTWSMEEESFKSEENYWPIRLLKMLARMPHEYETWLYHAHTIPNGHPAEAYASNTKLSGAMLGIPEMVDDGEGFFTLSVSEHKDIHFFSVLPLYEEEMDFKLKHGAEPLFEKLEQAGVTELLNVKRKNVCKKSFWFF